MKTPAWLVGAAIDVAGARTRLLSARAELEGNIDFEQPDGRAVFELLSDIELRAGQLERRLRAGLVGRRGLTPG